MVNFFKYNDSNAHLENVGKMIASNGKSYQIKVDNTTVVERTDDPGRFWDFEGFINSRTQSVEIIVFSGNSNRNDKFIYTFGDYQPASIKPTPVSDIPPIQDIALNGPDLRDQVIGEQKAKKKELKRKLKKKGKKIRKKLEREISEKQIREELENLKGKSALAGIVEQAGPGVLLGLLDKAMVKFPALAGFAGVPQQPVIPDTADTAAPTIDGQPEQKEQRTRRRRKDDEQPQGHSNEHVNLLTQLNQLFAPDEVQSIFDFLNASAHDKAHLEAIKYCQQNTNE